MASERIAIRNAGDGATEWLASNKGADSGTSRLGGVDNHSPPGGHKHPEKEDKGEDQRTEAEPPQSLTPTDTS